MNIGNMIDGKTRQNSDRDEGGVESAEGVPGSTRVRFSSMFLQSAGNFRVCNHLAFGERPRATHDPAPLPKRRRSSAVPILFNAAGEGLYLP
jgi:hypothetical protein